MKILRYFCYLAFAGILVYLVGNLSGLYPYRRVANNASSSKSDTSLIQEKRSEKPTLESRKEISDREKATGPQDLSDRIENLPRASLDLVLLRIMKGDDGYLEAIIEDR